MREFPMLLLTERVRKESIAVATTMRSFVVPNFKSSPVNLVFYLNYWCLNPCHANDINYGCFLETPLD